MREPMSAGHVGGRGQTAKSLKHLRTRSQVSSCDGVKFTSRLEIENPWVQARG